MISVLLYQVINIVFVDAISMCTNVDTVHHLHHNSSLPGASFYTINNIGMFGCANECLLRSQCKSFNYDVGALVCVLNNMTGGLNTGVDSVYSDISTWPNRLAGLCADHYCPESSVCLETSGTTICKIECDDPPALSNGNLMTLPVLHDVGSALNYTCDISYFKTGQATCQTDGTWSSFGCEGVTCSVDDITNVNVTASTGTLWQAGKVLNYTCADGYLTSGDLTCKTDGTWTSVTCEQGCSNPPNVENAVQANITGTFVVGTDLNLNCSYGYLPVGHMICQSNFTWSDMVCERVCTEIPTVFNGSVLFPGVGPWTNGTVIKYECDPVFRKPDSVLMCLEDGSWSVVVCPPVRSCAHIKACNSSYGDGEYWIYPGTFNAGDLVKLYCQNMAGTPQHFITLPGDNYVDYSDTRCEAEFLQTAVTSCMSARFLKVQVHQWMMVTYDNQLKNTNFINSSDCGKIRMGSVFDCMEGCIVDLTRSFRIDMSQTGLIVEPTTTWLAPSGTVSITRSADNRVIIGTCKSKCDWCYPEGNDLIYRIDPGYRPPLSSATQALCGR